MPDTLETRSLDQLPQASSVSADALTLVQETGGPMQGIAVSALLGRLIATDAAKETEADLQAALAYDPNKIALVFADADLAKNGWYRKTGASGAGNWVQFEKLTSWALAEITDAVDSANAQVGVGHAALAGAVSPLGLPGRFSDIRGSNLGSVWLRGALAGSVSALALAAAIVTYARGSTATEIGDAGLAVEVAAGVPALAYDAEGAVRGVAIRPAGSNAIAHPRDFRLTGPAYWLDEATTDIQHNVLDSPFGAATGTKFVANNGASAQKQLRQNRSVAAGTVYVRAYLVKAVEYARARITFPAAQFGGTNMSADFDLMTGQASLTGGTSIAPRAYGMYPWGNTGWYVIWASALCITTAATSSINLYIVDATGVTLFIGNGGGIGIAWAGWFAGLERPLSPWHGTGVGPFARSAETLSMPATGTRTSARAIIDNRDGIMPPAACLLSLAAAGSDAASVKVVEDGGRAAIVIRSGGVEQARVLGDAIFPGDNDIVATWDEVAKTATWSINGVSQPGAYAAAAPTGLNLWTFGHDAAGLNAINGYVAQPAVGAGIVPALKQRQITATGASAATVPTAATRLVFESSADKVTIYQHKYDRRYLAYDMLRVPSSVYATIAYDHGWYSGDLREVERTGEASFAQVRTWQNAGAEQDSMGINGRISPNDFLAIGAHGNWLKGKRSVWQVDGTPMLPADNHLLDCGDVMHTVDADGYHPDAPNALVANKSHRLDWNWQAVDYEPNWHWRTALNIDGGSYLHMVESQSHQTPFAGGFYNTGDLYLDTAWMSPDWATPYPMSPIDVDDPTTYGDTIRLTGPMGFSVESRKLSGFADRGFPKRSAGDTTNCKIYWPIGPAGSIIAVVDGTRWTGKWRTVHSLRPLP